MIPIKTPQEAEIMRQAGTLLANVMKSVIAETIHGVSTMNLDQLAEKLIKKAGAKPAFKDYKSKSSSRQSSSPSHSGQEGYPATLCTSINNKVVHGIPSEKDIIKNGDIIGLDCGLIYNGYYSDMAVTIMIGKVSDQVKKLVRVTKKCLDLAIEKIRPDIYLGDISNTIQSYAESNGFSVVRQLTGHGIGKELHEQPIILNYGKPGTGPVLKSGMTLAIEPMINIGDWKIKTMDDGWTVVTSDGSLSAHFEHTVLITETGSEILTTPSAPFFQIK